MNREQQSQLESLLEAAARESRPKLDLSSTALGFQLGEIGCKLLAERLDHLPRLNELDLSDGEIGADGIRLIMAKGRYLAGIRKLDLSGCGLGNDGVAELAGGIAQLTSLGELGLSAADVGATGLKLLRNGLRQLPLRNLDLSNNDLGDEGAETLASLAPDISRLRVAFLSFNDIGTLGAGALAHAAKHWPELGLLDLKGNHIGDAGADALAATELPSLRELYLEFNGIGPDGAQAIARAPRHWPRLYRLCLESNDVGDAGVAALIEALRLEPWRSSVEYLELGSNSIQSVPPEVLRSTKASVWRSYADELAHGGQRLPAVKVLLLGEGRVGKTHLRQRLFGPNPTYHNPGELQTHDIETAQWQASASVEGAPEEIKVAVWDFGGQTALHASHRLFLSDRRGLFVVVCDATRTRLENRLDYWLRVVRHEASAHSPIVVAVTKCDLHDDAGEDPVPRRLEQLDAGELRRAAGIPESTPVAIVEGIGWSRATGVSAADTGQADHRAALAKLQAAIVESIPYVPDLCARYPRSLANFIRWIGKAGFAGEDGVSQGWAGTERFRAEACRFSVPDDLFDIALDIGHSLGLIHFAAARRTLRSGEPLAGVVFNPEWVKTPAYRVIREANGSSSRGVLSWEQIESLLPAHEAAAQGVTLWERLRFTPADRVNVIDLMTACELLFVIDRGSRPSRYFVPDHLPPRRAPGPPAGEHVWRRDFEWLPEAEFGRLLGRLHQQGVHDQDALWRDEITVSIGRSGRMTVRLETIEPIVSVTTRRVQAGSTIFVSMSGCTENEAVRLLDQLDAELRSIRGERLVGPTMWTQLENRRRGQAADESCGVPEYTQYAVRVYTMVKDVHDRGGCDVKSWPDLVQWAARIVRARTDRKPDPVLAAAVREAQTDVDRFARYCREAKLRAWWSSRGKRKVGRSGVDWSTEDTVDGSTNEPQ